MGTNRPKAQIVSALRKKGFEEERGRHHVFLWFTHQGKRTGVFTKVSHSPKVKDIGAGLLSKMARQCRLTKSEFLDLVDCPLDGAAYREVLDETGMLSSD